MSSNKSFGFGATILVILLVALVVGIIGSALYLIGVVPSFNRTVDLYLNRTPIEQVIVAEPEPEQAPVSTPAPVVEPVPAIDASAAAETSPSDQVAEEVTVSLINQYLTPKEQAAKLILAGIRNWTGDSGVTLPEISFFYPRNADGSWSVPVEDYENRIIPFSPAEQGMYSIGLARDHGALIEALAFVAVFEENGEQLAVSLDYHSDRPNVSLHLRDDRIYYIVQGWFTDEHDIPEHTVLRVQEGL